jgi:hypothetical protein
VPVTVINTPAAREQKLETALPNQPKITGGDVVVHETSELVKA